MDENWRSSHTCKQVEVSQCKVKASLTNTWDVCLCILFVGFFLRYIIGKKGETRKRLELDTKTSINIPRQGVEGEIGEVLETLISLSHTNTSCTNPASHNLHSSPDSHHRCSEERCLLGTHTGGGADRQLPQEAALHPLPVLCAQWPPDSGGIPRIQSQGFGTVFTGILV